MELMQAIYGRRAVRSYAAAPITDAQIKILIEAAIQAPSAMNLQPWSFCVVRDQSLLTRISSECKSFLLRNPPSGSFPDHLRQALSDDDFHIFYHAPALIVISAVDGGTWGPIDCSLAAQNLMLAAHDTGLASCWVGLSGGWLGTSDGRAALNLPERHVPVAPIIVGYSKEIVPPVERATPPTIWIG